MTYLVESYQMPVHTGITDAEMASSPSLSFMVDMVRMESVEGATKEANWEANFDKATQFAEEVLAPQGFVPFIFVTYANKAPHLALWDRYEQKDELRLAWKAPVLEKAIPKWFRTYSLGRLADNSLSSARKASFKESWFSRIIFAEASTEWGVEQIRELHDAAYQKGPYTLGTPVRIRDLSLAKHLTSRGMILLLSGGIEGTVGAVHEFQAKPGLLTGPMLRRDSHIKRL